MNLYTDELNRNFLNRTVPRNLRNVLAQLAHFRASFERARKIRPDGFTMDSLGNVTDYTSGFAVATHGYESIDDLIRNNQNVLACGDVSSLHFGFWKDTDGTEYIDAVEVIEYQNAALETAFQLGQIAIWDFANKRELRLAEYDRVRTRSDRVYTFVPKRVASNGN